MCYGFLPIFALCDGELNRFGGPRHHLTPYVKDNNVAPSDSAYQGTLRFVLRGCLTRQLSVISFVEARGQFHQHSTSSF